jgi:ATP-dependent exoDNAse (exonuclease V) alpha subunit
MEDNIVNRDFDNAIGLALYVNRSVLITGKAGTGKSTLIKKISNSILKKFVVVAPTGIAAINAGGVTIHSFFKFPLRELLPNDRGIKIFANNSEQKNIILAMDTLIIDEISMVRADLIDAIDYSLRHNGDKPHLPFGGKQIIFVGDFFQLEPVINKDSKESKVLKEIYKSLFFYNAKVFENIKLYSVELKKVYRQLDLDFISLLDRLRVNELTQEDIDKLNTRVVNQFEIEKNDYAITLTTRTAMAANVNNLKLEEIQSKAFNYPAQISGLFEENKYPTESILKFKVGSQIIFIKNDPSKRWANGSLGKIISLNRTTIKVELNTGKVHTVNKVAWENTAYQYSPEANRIVQKVVGTFIQYPLKLAWAITIHKSQGLTFDRAIIDFGEGAFASGQAYVALSRVKTFEGLYLKQKIKAEDIFLNDEIKQFALEFKNDDPFKKQHKQ